MGEQTKTFLYIYTLEYYSTIKISQILRLSAKWIVLEIKLEARKPSVYAALRWK